MSRSELLSRIREAEARAAELTAEAGREAERTRAQAQREAAEIVAGVRREAKRTAEARFTAAREDVAQRKAKILDAGDAEVAQLRTAAEARIAPAAERFVTQLTESL